MSGVLDWMLVGLDTSFDNLQLSGGRLCESFDRLMSDYAGGFYLVPIQYTLCVSSLVLPNVIVGRDDLPWW